MKRGSSALDARPVWLAHHFFGLCGRLRICLAAVEPVPAVAAVRQQEGSEDADTPGTAVEG